MNPHWNAVDSFLEKTGMHPQAVDIAQTVEHMTAEMDAGLNGTDSSLAMIPTYIDADSPIPTGEKVTVLDAGGTNLRAAAVSFEAGGKPRIGNFSKHPMPGTQGTDVGKDEFFDSLASLAQPLLEGGKVGFCFSYPTEIYPGKDGRLLHWSKEIRAPEVEGRMIGENLRSALSAKGIADTPEVVILNDTVATLLTGKASQAGRNWGGYVGFILGTGTNTCYVESNSKVGKTAGLDAGKTQIINCEFGSYACQSRGEADLALDSKTARPETYWLEKMLSGGYFGNLATETLALASSNGLFSPGSVRALENLGVISTKDADNSVHRPDAVGNALTEALKTAGSEADRTRIWFLIDALLERAARLTAANLAASVLKGPAAKGPLNPACITIDGTTYYRYYRFQARVESCLRPFLTARDAFYETVQVEDASLIGAAVAALTN